MALAAESKFETVAFSLISASIFRGDRSLLDVLRLSVEAVCAHCYEELKEVHMVAFTGEELRALLRAAQAVAAAAAAPADSVELSPADS
jgi:hypothetical protein